MARTSVNHWLLAALALGTLATVACGSTESDTDSAGSAWDAESAVDETKSTHLWVVNRGVDILAKHTADTKTAANTLAWMQDEVCRENWQNGLLQADFLAPFNAAATDLPVPNGEAPTNIEAVEGDFLVAASHASWMSHFYDPATGKNYSGFAKSSDLPDDAGHVALGQIKSQVEVNGPVPVEAKGAALYRVARAQKLLAGTAVPSDHANEPEDKRGRGCYELGLALHYFTDLTQPMHSANFAATDRPRLLHSNWESYAEAVQAKFVRSDWSKGPTGDLDTVVQTVALAAKAHWTATDNEIGPLFEAILDAYRAGGTWDDSGKLSSDAGCGAAATELKIGRALDVAALITLDLPKCWQNNPTVLKETGAALGDAQEMTARFLATLSLPPHPND